MRNSRDNKKHMKARLGKLGFINCFRIRHMYNEKRTSFTVIFGLFVSLLITMLSLDCYVMCKKVSVNNKADIKYEYMYTYKIPDKEVPKGGVGAFAKNFSKEIYGYNLNVILLGIYKDNPFFNIDIPKGEDKVVISSAVAEKYNLKVGDTLTLNDKEEEKAYNFSIEGVTPYTVGLNVFMNLDSMRNLFEKESDYYNVVISNKPLDIDSNKLYSVTSREDICKSSDIFYDRMQPMIIMLNILSMVIFCIVMYMMMKIIIDHSSFSISLIKIFGYRKNEVAKLYLNGNFYIVAIGSAICIPLAKYIMDKVYPYLVSNVACGADTEFSVTMYVIIYVSILYYRKMLFWGHDCPQKSIKMGTTKRRL